MGQRHRLTIQPFAERGDLQKIRWVDETNDYTLMPYWVVSFEDA